MNKNAIRAGFSYGSYFKTEYTNLYNIGIEHRFFNSDIKHRIFLISAFSNNSTL